MPGFFSWRPRAASAMTSSSTIRSRSWTSARPRQSTRNLESPVSMPRSLRMRSRPDPPQPRCRSYESSPATSHHGGHIDANRSFLAMPPDIGWAVSKLYDRAALCSARSFDLRPTPPSAAEIALDFSGDVPSPIANLDLQLRPLLFSRGWFTEALDGPRPIPACRWRWTICRTSESAPVVRFAKSIVRPDTRHIATHPVRTHSLLMRGTRIK